MLKPKEAHNEYHGIIVNLSQKDKSIVKNLNVIGRKRVLFGLITLYKISVNENAIDKVIIEVQKNMNDRILFKKQEFYAHFYRNNELIIVFRDKIFKVTPDPTTWGEAVRHGRLLNIADGQLDFIPNRFEDETF